MSSLKIGDTLPDLNVKTARHESQQLADYRGKNLVMYFYPKDNTPGCTQEGKDFAEAYSQFSDLNTEIVGVSKDGVKAHNNFINKYEFPFDLISDSDEVLCNTLDVIKEKNMYGRKYMGIERSTFVFDTEGKLIKEFRKVKVKGHIDEVLECVKAL